MDDLTEAQRSRARTNYKLAAVFHEEARTVVDHCPTRAAMLENRSREHRELARETMRLLARLGAQWGAELEEIVTVHDLNFCSQFANREQRHVESR